jgi:hypothetical protein
MKSGIYKRYRIFGHAILQQEDTLSPERYAGSGTLTRDTTRVHGIVDFAHRAHP